jgi:hypothetical protein
MQRQPSAVLSIIGKVRTLADTTGDSLRLYGCGMLRSGREYFSIL